VGVDKKVVDVKLAQKGNKSAFVRLIKAAEVSMYRVAKAMVKSDAECADAIQETILKAYESIDTLRNSEISVIQSQRRTSKLTKQ
jgi:RNA polymerase sigma-70 factor (ECF subfamily)